MGIRNRLVAAALAVATLTAVGGVTTAAAAPGPTSGPGASAPGNPGKPGGGVSQAVLAKVAASLHVSVQRLVTALGDLKKAMAQGASKAAAVAGFAKELGVGVSQAEQALQALSNASGDKGKPGVPDAAVQVLAKDLHISVDRARAVFAELAKLTPTSGPITDNPGFVAIAKSLGLTPQQLQAALVAVKQQLGGQSGSGGSPTK